MNSATMAGEFYQVYDGKKIVYRRRASSDSRADQGLQETSTCAA